MTTHTCSKCGHTQSAPAPCHRCGFDFEKHPAPDRGSADGHQGLEAQWEQLSTRLDDAEGHEAFIKACAIAGQLEFAGQRYRDLDPQGLDARVNAYRQRVLNVALARLAPLSSDRDPRKDRLRVLLLMLFGAVLLLAFTAGIYYAGRAMEQSWLQ
ncbi:MAG: hypothetical protein ACE366_24985 [Bradymonadia bacterium]